MSLRKPKALVLCGEGLNGERETAHALALARFEVEQVPIAALRTQAVSLDQVSQRFSVLVLPGGASYGDALGAGKILALQLVYGLKWDLQTYVARGGLILGIGNGFQALIHMGIFGPDLSITFGAQGSAVQQWVRVTPFGSRSIWLRGLGTLDLPVRHPEGRILIAPTRRSETLEKLHKFQMLCLRYESDPYGSDERLAGLSDPTGRILGLMPHPECFVRGSSHPDWTARPARAGAPGPGLLLFENAYEEALASCST